MSTPASEISPVMFGRLIQSVDTLTNTVSEFRKDMHAYNTRLMELETKWRLGKLGISMLIVMGVFAVFGAREAVQYLFKLVI